MLSVIIAQNNPIYFPNGEVEEFSMIYLENIHDYINVLINK